MSWRSLLHEIRAQKLSLARLDPRAGMPVMPPVGATPGAIVAAEQRLGRALPPSYRALLAEHDGLPQLYQGAGLLGARSLARGTYVELARLVIDEPRDAGVPAPELFPFGIDTAGETIFAWDTGRARADGELEVVLWVNEIVERVDSFPAFLELVRDMLAAELDDRQRPAAPARVRRGRMAEPVLRVAAA
jgi:hypothetical protein